MADYIQTVMLEDSLVTSHPVYQPVNDPIEIIQLFDGIAYFKVSFNRLHSHSLHQQPRV